MKRCPFDRSVKQPCPAIGDYQSLLFEHCDPEEYGKNCAAIIAQIVVLATTGQEGVRSYLDELYGEIIGHYKPRTVSVSDAPPAIQEDVIKCSLPIRQNSPAVVDCIAIHHVDLTCTLLNNELLAASNWYDSQRESMRTDGTTYDWWLFKLDDGEVDISPKPKDTIAEFDQSFRLGSSVLCNATNPPLMAVEILRRRAGG